MAKYRIPAYFKSRSLKKLKIESWHMQFLKVKELQKLTDGGGVAIAIADTGIHENHEEFSNTIGGDWLTNIAPWEDFTTDRGIGPGEDHSTHVAGIIGGKTVGLFPGLRLGSFKVLTREGIGTSKWVYEGIKSAWDHGFEIINASLGSDRPDNGLKKIIKSYCQNQRHFLVCATGNDGDKTDFPAAWSKVIKGVISVAPSNVDANGTLYIPTFSSAGVVTVTAPGVNIWSSVVNGYAEMTGSSMAAPMISALIGAAKALRPQITQDEVLGILASTSTKIDTPKRAGHGHVSMYEFLMKVIDINEGGSVPDIDQGSVRKRCVDVIMGVFRG